jgi:hypothetical protein
MSLPRPARKRRRPAGAPASSNVLPLDARRIEKAIEQRERYRYVTPRVVREGLGWKVLSPNCSRNVDPQGGEIDIAWLVAGADNEWHLYARDHQLDCWQLRAQGTLPALLQQLAADPQREFWQ